jgi:hypothetical protein
MLRDIAAGVLIVLDCCHAEGMAQVKSFDEIEPVLPGPDDGKMRWHRELAQGVAGLFSSCQGGEIASLGTVR